ncbi:male sterility protein-domain-containing protein [Scenedesmus sp. NREL 46B-D3]|nr:male sterility protein-domain-containing protein [Scenedesmus sp. NREL 46B-D3]
MNPLAVWQRGGHPPNECPPGCSSYSIKQEFDGAVVFITGASGYIGSVVLEQLLRTTNVAKVYLLLRPRRGQTIQARADVLLQGALFHKVRDSTKLLRKVQVMGGDISLPGLGMSAADRATLLSSVDYIVHCAADIRLEADIQETLTSNFEGTRTVLELAAAAGHLKGLVHVSSAFVNMNQPRSSIVDEQVYPLKHGTQVVDVEELAQGKHMSEQLVTRYQAKQQLPVAIVRPSLVSAIAGEPYPGYVGNWAGPIGAGAAMAIGMFDCLESVASQPMGVWDIVPADLVASSIIAAAAAISAGVAASISRATRSGSISGLAADAAVVLGQPHPFSPAAHSARLQQVAEQHARLAGGPDISATIKVVEDDGPKQLKSAAAAAAAGGGEKPLKAAGRALSAASDDTAITYPLVLMEGWNYNLDFFDAHPPPFSLLRLLGKDKEAKRLAVGYETFCVHNNSKTDRDLVFSTHALVALEAALAPAEASEYLLVWRPITKRSGSGSSKAGSGREGQQQWAGRSEVQLAPVDGDVIWRRYLHTQMAGIYRMLFGVVPEQRQLMASAAAAAAGAEDEGTSVLEESFVEHDFRRIK